MSDSIIFCKETEKEGLIYLDLYNFKLLTKPLLKEVLCDKKW
jgi:hypothetical protein